jgi:parallel beta-helix repeat protein
MKFVSAHQRNLLSNKIKIMFFMMVICLALASTSWSENYYVDKNNTSASDSNPGSESRPWKTIQKGADVAVAGDIVYVKDGIYNEKVTVKNSGASGKPIVFIAYPGDKPILDGTGISLRNYIGLFTAERKNYITLDGFHVRNSAEVLVRMVYGTGFNLRNCLIHTNKASRTDGVFFRGVTDSFIDNNEVYDTQENAIDVVSSSNVKIRYNYIHDNLYHAAINIFPATNEEQVTYSGNDVMYNRIARIGIPGGAIYMRYQKDNIVAYNLVYDNAGYAIWFDVDRCSSSGPCRYVFKANTKIYNNTFVYNASTGIMNSNATHLDVKNNLIAFNGKRAVYVASNANVGHTFDYNLYYSQNYSGEGIHGTYTDPLFINPTKDNFDLQSGSPGWTASDIGGKVGAVPIPSYPGSQSAFQLSPPANLHAIK